MTNTRLIRHRAQTVVLLGALTAAACGNDDRQAKLDSAGGNIALNERVAEVLDVPVSAERLEQWQRAEQTLAQSGDSAPLVRINSRSLTDRDVDKAVARLDGDAPAKRAIESSGMSVRDFVLTTLAIANAMDAAGGPNAPAFRGALAQNVELVRRNEAAIRRVRETSRVRVDHEDSDEDGGEDSDGELEGGRRGRNGGEDSDRDSGR